MPCSSRKSSKDDPIRGFRGFLVIAFDILFPSHGQIPNRFAAIPRAIKIGGNFLTNAIKTLTYQKVIYNSRFTKGVIQKQLPLARSAVVYPPIDSQSFLPGKKQKLILSVARFDSPSHAKRQDVLLKAFKVLFQKEKNYRLVLAGGVKGEGGKVYLKKLQREAGSLPVDFIANPDFNKLKQLYAQAQIFWHAAGYGVDEMENPEKVEHFGMTTVEAMAAGCVPVVIDKGGQREIVTPATGFLCLDEDQIVEKTNQLLNNPAQLKSFSNQAVNRAKEFSQTRFSDRLRSLL